ncbi:Hint domain-containing protein [Psychrobacter sp. I-STPA10]|uniref:Hint domain-containing protein n=1 Tax=Psychrobacter sp. I-STPA10 TaxID=2585769 RepID=UPI001E2D0D2C|nr:Hint domain-containing protein [Psychrobacter sp. I-STPA10]
MSFVAGTLVHTDKGLVPIQNIKVGDLVLSKPENGNGELEYKPVLSTFKSPVKEYIYKIEYYNVTAAERGEKGLNYIFCTDNHPFWVTMQPVSDANADLQGEWFGAANLPPAHLTSAHGDEIELSDYAIMPVRTLPNFPAGCAYVQHVEEHDDGWNDAAGAEFVEFTDTGYHFVSLAETENAFRQQVKTLSLRTSDAKHLINENAPFLVDYQLYATLSTRLDQDIDPNTHSVTKFIDHMNSPLMDEKGKVVSENKIGIESLYKQAIRNLEKYGDATGLTETSLHEQMQRYTDDCPNPYEDYVYNIEVADHHTYFVGHDRVWVHE